MPSSRDGGLHEPHCRTCHSSRHYACVECGKCTGGRGAWGQPTTHRLDRRFCSSTCRQKNFKYWRTPEGVARKAERAARLALVTAEFRKRFGEKPPPTAKQETEARAKETAEVCGKCGADTPTTQPVWRLPEGLERRILPVCYACRCDLNPKTGEHWGSLHCAECEPKGWAGGANGSPRVWHGHWTQHGWTCPRAYDPDHPKTYCDGCHPLVWQPAKPCEGCGRSVMDHIHNRPRYLKIDGYYTTGQFAAYKVRVVCSERCRKAIQARERAENRLEREPIDCAVCQERIDARRRDAHYCSAVCRQQAYRARKAQTP